MIINESELQNTKMMLEKFETAVKNFDTEAVAKKNGTSIRIAEAELRALRSQIEEFNFEIKAYETKKASKAIL